MFEQCPTDAPASRRGVNIKLIDPLLVEYEQSYCLTLTICDPGLTGRKNYFLEPLANLLIGMDCWRNQRD
jgi:hypothetical protein